MIEHRKNRGWRSAVILRNCGLMLLVGMTMNAFAANCTPYPANGTPEVFTVNIAGNFSVGNELPVGSTIYRSTVTQVTSTGIQCDATYDIPYYFSVSSEPSGPPFTIPMDFPAGPVYPTNVPGIGVTIWNASRSFSSTQPLLMGAYKGNGGVGSTQKGSFDFSLIKTGPINNPGDVQGSSFPTMIAYAGTKSGYSSLPITTLRVNFTGTMHYTVPTCETPDQTISMKSYDLHRDFTGPGYVTRWENASIQLQNCQTFSGHYWGRMGQGVNGGGTPSGGTLMANTITVSLNPLTNFLSTSDGIFAVTGTNDDSDAAKGIGIQLGYSTDMNADPSSPTTIWKPGVTWTVTPPSDGTANLRIPLAARYNQTGAVVSPGIANGKVVFTLSYQ